MVLGGSPVLPFELRRAAVPCLWKHSNLQQTPPCFQHPRALVPHLWKGTGLCFGGNVPLAWPPAALSTFLLAFPNLQAEAFAVPFLGVAYTGILIYR